MSVSGMNVTIAQIKQAWKELKGFDVPDYQSLEASALELIEVYGRDEFRRAAGLPVRTFITRY